MIDRVRDWAGWRAKVQLRPDACRVVGARTRAAGGLKREARRDRHRTLWCLDAGADAVVGADRACRRRAGKWPRPGPRAISDVWCLRSGAQSEERGTLASKRINGAHILGPRASSSTWPLATAASTVPASSEWAFNYLLLNVYCRAAGVGEDKL